VGQTSAALSFKSPIAVVVVMIGVDDGGYTDDEAPMTEFMKIQLMVMMTTLMNIKMKFADDGGG
jgi:hypothetical protein